MKVGVDIFLTDYSISPVALGPACEARGFESVWLPEHSHIPTSRASPWPGGAELPKRYYDVLDPFVALAAMAAVTRTLKLGTGICLIIQRDTIQLAKETATLDRICAGRLLFGIGAGWNAEEMADHGTAFDTRFKLMREKVEAIKTIWTAARAEYHGELVDFGPMMSWPKPVQRPHPPVIVGGGWPQAARRAVAYGDGWIPLGGRGEDIAARLPAFRQMARDAGRDAEGLEVTVFGVKPDAEVLARLRDAGVARVTLTLPSKPEAEVLAVLDAHAELAGL